MSNRTPILYTVGGTVQAGGGVYIQRAADLELLTLCRNNIFAYVLSSRQVGKSSLMVRTAQELEKDHIRTVIIDLSSIGILISVDEWYLGILSLISENLGLNTDVFLWWRQNMQLGPSQRLSSFLRDVLLKEVTDHVVIFIDEIDTTLSITFSDDFFATIRAIYNSRATTPDWERLSFVLVGVATPSDLIADARRTPFNIGQRVDLVDFSLQEALALAGGLGTNGEQVLGWVLEWTNGHPYLTQGVCAYLARYDNQYQITEKIVEEAVTELFLNEGRDSNIIFVRNMLTKHSPNTQVVLRIYRNIYVGKRISDNARSISHAHLKIAGIVKNERGFLVLRNRIYQRVFDLEWLNENMNSDFLRQVPNLSLWTIFMALVTVVILFYFNKNGFVLGLVTGIIFVFIIIMIWQYRIRRT